MDSLTIASLIFACIVGGALIGLLIRTRLSSEHMSSESKEVVKVAMGLVATMSALVLGLMVASAKSTFDAQRAGIAQLSGNVIFLDRTLARYGPEAKGVRDSLQEAVTDLLHQTWPEESSHPHSSAPKGTEGRYEHLYDMIQSLKPENEAQRTLQAQALKTATDIGQSRWLLFAQKGRSIPAPFLAVVVAWITLLFASFSLFAPRNAVSMIALLVAALSVSGAIFLVLELDQPFEGILRIPSTPVRAALEHLGK